MIIGSHVNFNKEEQIIGSIKQTLEYGANAFMFYTGAPQNTNRAPIDEELSLLGKKVLEENNIDINNVIVHAPYIINMANSKNEDFNIDFLRQEIERVELLGVNKIVIHPGSHVGLGIEEGINNIVKCLNRVLNKNTKVNILLETMAGKGTEIGSNFYELKKIMDNVSCKERVKVCMDTCHMNDAGYDVTNFDKLLDEFDEIIGLENLECIHINDSKNEINSHKDRHENIGFGKIGFDNMLNIIYNERIKNVPKILETPYVSLVGERTYPPYKFEIEMIKNKKLNNNLISDIEKYYN